MAAVEAGIAAAAAAVEAEGALLPADTEAIAN
jgi:hypothetical protein